MERITFDSLDQYLLLKNGNYLYKVPYLDGFAVLKVYFDSRGWPERVGKTLDNIIVMGQTSFMPRARLRTEQAALKIWRDAGFRVFKVYDDVEVDVTARALPRNGYALFEYVPGRNFHRMLPDESVPMEERMAFYREFLVQWHRRHTMAVEKAEPRLIHENGDLKHVMEYKGELFWFDFEMCFRSRFHVEDLVSREILAYLKSLGEFLPPALHDVFFRETMEHYGNRAFLRNTYDVLFNNRNPFIRLARRLDYRFRKRSRKTHSKYNVALRIKKYLDEHP